MDRSLTLIVPSSADNLPLIQYLRQAGISRSLLTAMKADPKALQINHEKAGGKTPVHTGDVVQVRFLEPRPEDFAPGTAAMLPCPILYEDEDLLVVNKPAGMPVHPSMGHHGNTLSDAVCAYFRSEASPFAFRCINRLDRDTTGALIIAKNPISAAFLYADMRARRIHRTYLAVAGGCTPLKGTVDAPISRTDGSTIERRVDPLNGETAVTRYERIDYRNGQSLLLLNLETGRTHQIRVHLSYIGHPLPGDFLYNPDYTRIRRQALHSLELSFPHPITRENLLLTAPVPPDLVSCFLG